MPPRFATAINCIDGRAQVPLIEWVKLHFTADFVDLITPGADGALARQHPEAMLEISRKVALSHRVHHPRVIAVSGHYDCLANPASNEEHREKIHMAVEVVASWGLGVRIVGAWINEWSSVDLVCDTNESSRIRYDLY